jgi:hypothetical protein
MLLFSPLQLSLPPEKVTVERICLCFGLLAAFRRENTSCHVVNDAADHQPAQEMFWKMAYSIKNLSEPIKNTLFALVIAK